VLTHKSSMIIDYHLLVTDYHNKNMILEEKLFDNWLLH